MQYGGHYDIMTKHGCFSVTITQKQSFVNDCDEWRLTTRIEWNVKGAIAEAPKRRRWWGGV